MIIDSPQSMYPIRICFISSWFYINLIFLCLSLGSPLLAFRIQIKIFAKHFINFCRFIECLLLSILLPINVRLYGLLDLLRYSTLWYTEWCLTVLNIMKQFIFSISRTFLMYFLLVFLTLFNLASLSKVCVKESGSLSAIETDEL